MIPDVLPYQPIVSLRSDHPLDDAINRSIDGPLNHLSGVVAISERQQQACQHQAISAPRLAGGEAL
eukprot:CAMPEP_0198124210 /NCGR_PEP_ID=MMETSP1442-20131203/39435_1 /TAXON_ID= /ORGANISM="Craspedostauros australis, Strain CCMP3328" /LENGTH=65 /DNA_ID=CAMNT_0043783573 /DNA_START=56 /DNA_END=253 /DNA_ORIENTATION=-